MGDGEKGCTDTSATEIGVEVTALVKVGDDEEEEEEMVITEGDPEMSAPLGEVPTQVEPKD